MAAGPGSKVYGRLSVMLQAYCHVDAAVRRAAGRVPAAAEGRFGGGAAGAARAARRSASHDPERVRGRRARRLRPAPQDPAQRAVEASRRGRDRGRRRAPGRARRADRSRRFRPPGQLAAAPSRVRCTTDGAVDARRPRRVDLFARITPYTVGMERSTDYAIDIAVATRYLDDQSAPERGPLRLRLHHPHPQQRPACPRACSRRHWLITDANGKVAGSATAKAWSANSPGCAPATTSSTPPARCWKPPSARCDGSYDMLADDGTQFDAPIPAFTLSVPRTLH